MDARKPRERLLGPALRTQPDRRLVALARDGSEPAQEEIVRRYRAALVRYAGSIVGAAAAEDVVQDALTKGVAALGRVNDPDDLRLRPWLYAIVRNTALNHRRDAGPATEQLDENYDGVEQPPQALERRESVRSLFGGLRELPPQQREALVKRELEGRSHDEVASALGVSSGAARQLIFRARESLRVGFGSLLPMPLLRWLGEGGGDGAVGVAAGAGGGALAAKAAVAVFAAGAAVSAGVAIDHEAHRPAAPVAEAAVSRALVVPGPAADAAVFSEPSFAATNAGDDGRGERSGHSDEDRGEGDSSGPGSGKREDGDDGRGPSESSGPGSGGDDSGGGEDRSGGSGQGDRSGHGGPGRSGGDDDSGSSHSGHGGKSDSDHGSSGSGDSDGSSSGSSGKGGSRFGSDDSGSSSGSGGETSGSSSGGDDGGSGSSSGGSGGGGGSEGGSDGSSVSGGGSDVEVAAVSEPAAVESDSGSSGGSGSSDSGGGSDD
jgi:RNA polymerase sigma factor (sigma-70 family)